MYVIQKHREMLYIVVKSKSQLNSITMEIWKDIPGLEGVYQVSNKGRLKSVERRVNIRDGKTRTVPERILKQRVENNGYMRAGVSRFNKKFHISVHRAVLEAFVPNPENKPQCNHINGIKTDNRVENLEWATGSENQRHSHENGLKIMPKGSKHHNTRFTEKDVRDIKKMLADGVSQSSIAEDYGVNPSTISNINTGKNWTHVT